jgi:PPOX class probable F420-dependent enzyme
VEKLTTSRDFWLATVRPDGRPHLAPVWCLWHDNALYFSTDPSSRKGRNLAHNANCSVSTDGASATVTVEGIVSICDDFSVRQSVAEQYAAKYEWVLTATETGVALEDGVSTPLYMIRPTTVLGMTDEVTSRMTRWRFPG